MSGQNEEKNVRLTFYLTYVMLMTTGTITFIEALRNKSPIIRHVMNIETCISIVAAFFYSDFVKRIREPVINYRDLTSMRYLDWFITTPLMILGVSLMFAHNNTLLASKTSAAVFSTTVTLTYFVLIVLVNSVMLTLGYLGEVGTLSRPVAHAASFVAYFATFALMYFTMVRGTSWTNVVIFLIMAVVWLAYGFAYLLDERTKNICYNVLDLISKCFMGIVFWAYFTRSVTLA